MPLIKRFYILFTLVFLVNMATSVAQTGTNFSDPSSLLENVSEGIYVPNFFTPNYDGVNDAFYVSNKGITEYRLKIFDRYGILVFDNHAPNVAWDGTTPSGLPVSSGTYFYVLVAKSATTDYSGKGKISLLR